MHAHWRDYAPGTGRWQQQDPVGFAAGDANLYRYVGNGPTAATDPSGLYLVVEQGAQGAYVAWLAEHGVQAATVELPKRGLFCSPRVGVAVSAAEGEKVRAWYDATPDPNPIKNVVAKAKDQVRTRKPRTKAECDALCGECLDWFSPAECWNYLRHAGYGPQD